MIAHARSSARLLLALLCTGCTLITACSATPTEGYAATSPFPSAYRSVSVPVFRNDSLLRGSRSNSVASLP